MQINALYVIIKLVERCNLKCSYCYYYTDENSEVYGRPSLMGSDVLDNLLDFIDDAIDEVPVRRVVFGFHGGEPTLAKAEKARAFCELARERLSHKVEVLFALQTNGVHVSPAWLQLIEDERIGVGISIDGPEHLHDRYRVDHRDRGSYARVIETLGKLLPLDANGRIQLTGLVVMGAEFTGVPLYRHLVEDLGLRHLKLLFTDRTNEEPLSDDEAEHLGQMLCAMFDYWLLNHYGQVDVTLFDSAVRSLLASRQGLRGDTSRITLGMALLSDGRIRIPDDFMIAKEWFWSQRDLAVGGSSLREFLDQPHLQQMIEGLVQPPSACSSCEFKLSCAGGEVAHRYTREHGMEGRSVYCAALFAFYRHVQSRLREGQERLMSSETEHDLAKVGP